jgi:hypothetical protein
MRRRDFSLSKRFVLTEILRPLFVIYQITAAAEIIPLNLGAFSDSGRKWNKQQRKCD